MSMRRPQIRGEMITHTETPAAPTPLQIPGVKQVLLGDVRIALAPGTGSRVERDILGRSLSSLFLVGGGLTFLDDCTASCSVAIEDGDTDRVKLVKVGETYTFTAKFRLHKDGGDFAESNPTYEWKYTGTTGATLTPTGDKVTLKYDRKPTEGGRGTLTVHASISFKHSKSRKESVPVLRTCEATVYLEEQEVAGANCIAKITKVTIGLGSRLKVLDSNKKHIGWDYPFSAEVDGRCQAKAKVAKEKCATAFRYAWAAETTGQPIGPNNARTYTIRGGPNQVVQVNIGVAVTLGCGDGKTEDCSNTRRAQIVKSVGGQ